MIVRNLKMINMLIKNILREKSTFAIEAVELSKHPMLCWAIHSSMKDRQTAIDVLSSAILC